MKLAYVTLQGRGRTDALIAEVATLLEADEVRLAGTVQSNHERPDQGNCDRDLRVLPDGPVVRISASARLAPCRTGSSRSWWIR